MILFGAIFFSKQGAPWKITLKKTDGLPDALCTTSTTHTMHHKSIIPCGKMKIAADDDELEKSYLVLYIHILTLRYFPYSQNNFILQKMC